MLFLRVAIFTALIPGTVTVLVPYVLLHSDIECALGLSPALRPLGLLPLSAGIITYIWCARDFALSGRGTPAPYDPPRMLVTRGLYGYVRNPMYLGVVSIILGEAVSLDSIPVLGYAALLLVMFHLRVLLYEERQLRKAFGGSYEEYYRSVPRWLPRMPRRRHHRRPESRKSTLS
jgi:protein-S-isoprenylcysteine O-methyltransferase Ste14